MDFIEIDKKEREDEWSMSELQSHSYYELYFLLRGERRFFLKDRIFNISAPTVCIIPPFCMHKTEGDAYKRTNINVSQGLLREEERDMLDELGKSVVFTLDPKRAELVLSLLDGASEDEINTHSYVAESFMHILLHLLRRGGLLPYVEEARESREDAIVMKAVSFIQNRYMEDFSIDSLAREIYVSKNTLCQHFRSVMNCSVMEYRQLVRINKAKDLLVSTAWDMKRISESCGFSSANYFSLIFKKEVGISPLNYRKSK